MMERKSISFPCLSTSIFFFPFSLVFAIFAASCTSQPSESQSDEALDTESISTALSEPPVVEVVARGLKFEAPDEISSGWNTIRLDNQSNMVHFALLSEMPEGRGIEDHQKIIAPIFQNFMDDFNNKPPSVPEVGFELPEWFSEVVFLSGPGLLSAGWTAENTINLQPGTYLLECYVKTNGVFHSFNPDSSAYGMVHEIRVTDETTQATAPESSIKINISSTEGIEVNGNVGPGDHIVEVKFLDQKTYGHFLGHDVHLVRLEERTDLEEVAEWMNWTKPGGLETPAPAEFLGGTHEMPAGSTAYFKVSLEPGDYAWISEVPDPEAKGMLKRFTVSGENL